MQRVEYVENLGNAAIVSDKYHALSQVSAAVDEVRCKEARQDAVAREHLEKTCWLWGKNPERWTEREERHLEGILAHWKSGLTMVLAGGGLTNGPGMKECRHEDFYGRCGTRSRHGAAGGVCARLSGRPFPGRNPG
ncbi:MAG: transposase [Verrucomicrobia bacterium]|nr:transposase [Verrucomicrobiota bacterium]